jgi:hypothetical protein
MGMEKPSVTMLKMGVCILDKEERKNQEKHEVGKDHENQTMKWSKRKEKKYCITLQNILAELKIFVTFT